MNRDLSLEHQLTGTLFESLYSEDDWEQFKLSEDQVQFYHEFGYLSGVKILDENQADSLCEELSQLADKSSAKSPYWYEFNSNESVDPNKVLFHALGAWRIQTGFHDILWNPRFTVPASQLLGGAVRFWHDQLFCKPAKHGGVVAWHQDYSYWIRTIPMGHLTCWIGLDKSTRDNGCLNYIPGSHRWDLLPITGLAGDMTAIRGVLDESQWEQFNQPHLIELNRGECAFHHPLMVHGSFENRTDGPRRAVVLNTMLDGTRSDSNEALLSGVPAVPKGEKVDGQFFPLLYSPS